MDTPKHLFHYTTIESLALILKNKTIRFNSLRNVDDLEEQESADLSNFGKFCFTSCWTAEEKENIALWNMYSKNGTGIRIKLPAPPFKMNKIEIPQSNGELAILESNYKSITINDNSGNILFYFWPPKEVNITSVIYTEDDSLRKPKICYLKENEINIKWDLLGNIKSSLWSFQNEWRFSFCVMPPQLEIINFQRHSLAKIKQYCEQTQPPFEYYDISLDEKCLLEMEILMGPSTTESDLVIVKSLINTYNPNAKIELSNIRNTVRFKH